MVLAFAIGLLFLLVLIVLLYLTQSAFEVWTHLKETPGWFLAGFGGGILALTGSVAWVMWRLLMPERSKAPAAEEEKVPPAPSEEELQQRIDKAAAAGVDVQQVRAELRRLQQRREAGFIHVSLFGEISSGKSSLIKALLPDAEVEVGARGGTTRQTIEYRWRSAAGDELVLVDVPGTNEVGAGLDELSRAEAQRAHLVLYVCDGDLSRSQWEELQQLLSLDKPCILSLNKTDRYSQAELELLKSSLRNRLDAYPRTDLVAVQTGAEREVLRILPDGSEEMALRPVPPRVEELSLALQRRIDDDPQLLERLRDSAVFSLAAQHLDRAESEHRRKKSDELVASYARKAVLGAMAAVVPGSDLLIQGYLGVSLIKELSELYEVPVRKADRDRLLSLVGREVGKTMTLVLAVAGNALKAFPGVGTLVGGVIHAVAYGLVFQSLGRAVARSFESRGELHPLQTAWTFKENLGEDLEISARDFAEMALRLAREYKDKERRGEA